MKGAPVWGSEGKQDPGVSLTSLVSPIYLHLCLTSLSVCVCVCVRVRVRMRVRNVYLWESESLSPQTSRGRLPGELENPTKNLL